jgi:ribA/ribD-fused uncharacterized protein
MAAIVMEKFRQNRYLQSILLATQSHDLAEANPYDAYWGIGTSAKDAIDHHNDWTGNNTMGEILMDVRRLIREDTQTPKRNA